MKTRLPRALLFVALAAITLAILHALGVRRSTSVLAGIAADPVDATLALVYIGCWFFTILLGPIALLSAVLLHLDAIANRRRRQAIGGLDELP